MTPERFSKLCERLANLKVRSDPVAAARLLRSIPNEYRAAVEKRADEIRNDTSSCVSRPSSWDNLYPSVIIGPGEPRDE